MYIVITLLILFIFKLLGRMKMGVLIASLYIFNIYLNEKHKDKLEKKYNADQLKRLKLANFKTS